MTARATDSFNYPSDIFAAPSWARVEQLPPEMEGSETKETATKSKPSLTGPDDSTPDQMSVLIRCARELEKALGKVQTAKLSAVSVDDLNTLGILAASENLAIGMLKAEAEAAYEKLYGDLVEEIMKPNASGTRLRTKPACVKAEKQLRAEKAIVARLKSSHSDLRALVWGIRSETRVMKWDEKGPKYDHLPEDVYKREGI